MDLPNPGVEPRSPALQADFILSEPPGKYLAESKEGAIRNRGGDVCVYVCVCVLTNVSNLYHSGLTGNSDHPPILSPSPGVGSASLVWFAYLSSPKEDWLEPQFSSFPITAAQTKDPGLEQSVLRYRG